ncbi:hypothetical protein TGAM01_v209654 [Trichoderma gamsii]|uniref:Uncharacterized protein n=1 Tax=Trichoderma gamsii TaxID=398673 RepID=A0A2P4ZB72_9HYPO|nr:hypothetical protein TGAM01_v209654 [Trichoderma gamsii]PON21491.1 hypothetical protein TGAM01_v209654 [Trichoderma gamsii]
MISAAAASLHRPPPESPWKSKGRALEEPGLAGSATSQLRQKCYLRTGADGRGWHLIPPYRLPASARVHACTASVCT